MRLLLVLFSAFLSFNIFLSSSALAQNKQEQPQRQMTPEEKKQFERDLQRIYCYFLIAQRQFDLRSFYAVYSYKEIYLRLREVLKSPKYAKLANYYFTFDNKMALAPEAEEARLFTDYIQLQTEAFKEAGVAEKNIIKNKFSTSPEQIKSVSFQVDPRALAILGFDPKTQEPYIELFHVFNDRDKSSENSIRTVNNMNGLPLRINEIKEGVYARLSPINYLYELKLFTDAGGGPRDSQDTPAVHACRVLISMDSKPN